MALLNVRRFLRRLRPAGAPGAPAGAAVPSDRAAEFVVELGPVFAALEEVQAEYDDIIGRALTKSEAAAVAARAEADRLTSQAREQATRAAASIRSARARESETVIETILSEARQTAQRVEARSQERIPLLADEVVDSVRQWALSAGDAARAEPAGDVDGSVS